MRRVLLFSSLFPNAEQPRHGIFIQTRAAKLLDSGDVDLRVVAPVPWFPSKSSRWGRFATFARVPRRERRGALDVLHPRFLSIPGSPPGATALAMAAAALPAVRRLIADGFDFDLIDAHFYYPDGVAAALLARWVGKPYTVTARGSDITFWPGRTLPRAMLRWAARGAGANAAVSAALAEEMARLGIERVKVLRNGVDTGLFFEEPREATRARLGLSGRVLLSVGNLIELKGHHLAIDTLQALPDTCLVIIGDGPDAAALRQRARDAGVAEHVRFVPVLPQAELRSYYSAADVLVLASSREGWPNVLLEAMACGTRAVAPDVWGMAEIITEPAAGELATSRSVPALVAAIGRVLAGGVERAATRAYACRFGWEATTRAQIEMFDEVLRASQPVRSRAGARVPFREGSAD
ncbi:glycosyltransferase [Azoarcus olearius]|uniref:glycosyltransferase n=1 Tax=Azoarcus sp. (strain BH72) TaxID=418699 RepID=UPI00080608FD|nr:glycosyltransferase [Azoarcus olearius]ANQ86428.1 glycosyltransferase [Azoarcus olearius]